MGRCVDCHLRTHPYAERCARHQREHTTRVLFGPPTVAFGPAWMLALVLFPFMQPTNLPRTWGVRLPRRR